MSTPLLDIKKSIKKNMDETSIETYDMSALEESNRIERERNSLLSSLIEECRKPTTVVNHNYNLNFYVSCQSEEDVSRFQSVLSSTLNRFGLK